jgi:ribosomal protein L37E
MEYIELKLAEFRQQYHIKTQPVDCVALLQEMKRWERFPVQTVYREDVPGRVDAAAVYIKELDNYQVLVNYKKVRYPFQKSSDRRLNFTIAHEIGHIILEHLLIAKDEKDENNERDMDEQEADEFAARLLMPGKLICTCNYYSLDAVSSYMNVSNTALKVRLRLMGRTDILTARKIKSCSRCGNIRFSPFAQYCGVCGLPIQGLLHGNRRIYYPDEVSMDGYKRVLVCPKCRKDISHIDGDRCTHCGTCIFNFCSDSLSHTDNGCTYANPAYARYCEMCGKPACYSMQGFLKNWQDAVS